MSRNAERTEGRNAGPWEHAAFVREGWGSFQYPEVAGSFFQFS